MTDPIGRDMIWEQALEQLQDALEKQEEEKDKDEQPEG